MQTAADRGQLPEAGSNPRKQFLNTWLESIKSTVATHTYIPYERDCEKAIIPHLGGVKLANLSALHVQKLYADLSNAGVSTSMQRKAGVTLGVALNHAVKLKLIYHNVARDVPKPKYTPPEMQVLGPDTLQMFLAEAKSDRLYALYVFLLDSGAREGEAFALVWSDLDWQGGAVEIVRNLEETKGQLKGKGIEDKEIPPTGGPVRIHDGSVGRSPQGHVNGRASWQ